MELNKVRTAKFTSPRDVTIVSPDGSKCQHFEAGETKAVHEALFGVAVQSGLMPEEPLDIASHEKAVEAPPKLSREEIVQAGLLEACRTLILRGNPGDFTMAGQPRAAAVKKLVNFDFTANDVRRAFEEASLEVETDGNDSTEHSESSSSAAE